MFDIFHKKQDELIDFDSQYVVVRELGIRGYEMTHFDTCERIWNELVPDSGQADSVQGELLRMAEKLRNEAMGNGNLNWDDNFEWFCDFIKKTLVDSGIFEAKEVNTITGACDYMKACGQYALRYQSGLLSAEDVNPMLLAYTEDDLYNFIEDAIALFAEAHPEKISYEVKGFIYR